MLNKFSRRIQKFVPLLKFLGLLVSAAGLVYLVVTVPPSVVTITIFGVLLLFALLFGLSFFWRPNMALLAAVIISFLVFLRMVDLLTIVNLALFGLFLVLLAVYLAKR